MSNEFDYEVEKAQAVLEGERWKVDQIELLQLLQSDENIRLIHRPRRSGKTYALVKMQQWWSQMGDNCVIITPNIGIKHLIEKDYGNVSVRTIRYTHVTGQYDKVFIDEWTMITDEEIAKVQNMVKPGGVVYGLGTPMYD